MLRRIFDLLSRDISGRTWTVEATHPYFGKMTRLCSRRGDRDYWEAELTTPKQATRFSVTFRGTVAGPTESELAFCRSIVGDLDATFERCRPAFLPKFETLVKAPLPDAWTEEFSLDGIDLPPDGDPNGEWHICYAATRAQRYFTAHFSGGSVVDVVTDG